MEVKLIIIGGKASKAAVTVKTPAVIGRSKQADLTVGHPLISRRHCELCEAEGLLKIRDLESLNGTMIANERVTEATLQPGEEFSIGPITFQASYDFGVEAADDAAPAASNGQTAAIPPATAAEDDEEPDFGFLDPAADSSSDTPASGISDSASPPDWDDMTPDHLADSREGLGEAEEIEEIEEIEAEEEFEGFEIAEEEPEPTPPPPAPAAKPATKHDPPAPPKPSQAPPAAKATSTPDDDAADAWEEVQTEAAEDLITGGIENSKIGKKRKLWPFGNGKDKNDRPEPVAQPAAPKSRPAAPRDHQPESVPDFVPTSDAAQEPVESGDEALDDFLKGLQ